MSGGDLNPMQLAIALVLVAVAMYVIKFACDSFEPAADYLGTEVYKMGPGIRGASIEAVASSLPELFTTMFLLFFFHDEDGFSAGIATCAGSAIFNGAVIPAICILAVIGKEIDGEKVTQIELGRSTLVRDGFFFMLAEIVFIVFLNGSELSWWMGGCLMLIYVIYAAVLVQGVGAADEEGELTTTLNAFSNPMLEEGKGSEDLELADRTKGGEDTDDTADADEPESETDAKSEVGQPEEPDSADADDEELPSCGLALVTFDFNPLIYSSSAEDFSSASQAWVVLLCSTLVIAFACYVLAEAVMLSAKALGIAPYFTAVILGAAASSVPDTYISYKDALKGDYDDAVANAIGSNIFDICFALGLPLFLYGLIHGSVAMNEVGGSAGGGSEEEAAEIQSLRILLIVCSVVMIGVFGLSATTTDSQGRTKHVVGSLQAYLLLGIYTVWTVVIVLQAAEVIQF